MIYVQVAPGNVLSFRTIWHTFNKVLETFLRVCKHSFPVRCRTFHQPSTFKANKTSWVLHHIFTGRTLTRRRKPVLESCAGERTAKAGSGLPNTSAHRWICGNDEWINEWLVSILSRNCYYICKYKLRTQFTCVHSAATPNVWVKLPSTGWCSPSQSCCLSEFPFIHSS